MNEWDPPIQALLEASRQVRPRRDAKAVVRRRLAATLAATAAGGTVAASSPWLGAKVLGAVKAGCAVLPGAGVTSAASTSALLLGPVVVGLALGLAAVAPSSADAPKVLRDVTRPDAPLAKSEVPLAAPRRASEAKAGIESAETPANTATSASAPSEAKVAPSRSDFAAQSALIERARVVLRQGDSELALRALAEYRRLYPQGMFFVEAITLEAQALCAAGHIAEGKSRLTRLEATGTPSAALQAAKRRCAVGQEP